MAVLHRTWLFRPREFHENLRHRVGAKAFSETALKREARAISRDHSGHEYLRMLGWDPIPNIDEASWGELYVICMTPFLQAMKPISGFGLLCGYLERLDDSEEVLIRLQRGDPLKEMLDEFPRDSLIDVIQADLDLGFGGWLSAEAARHMDNRLEAYARNFDPCIPALVEELLGIVGGTPADVSATITGAFNQARATLRAVLTPPGHALRVVFP
jgi:hypothetical protein